MYAVSSFLSSPLVSAFRQPRLRLSDCQVWESQRLLRPLQRDPKAESKVKLHQQMQESLNPKHRQRPLFPLNSSQNVYPERRTQEGCGENKRIHPQTNLFKYLLARQAFMQAMLCIKKKEKHAHSARSCCFFHRFSETQGDHCQLDLGPEGCWATRGWD